jgi:hypothetical protein
VCRGGGKGNNNRIEEEGERITVYRGERKRKNCHVEKEGI